MGKSLKPLALAQGDLIRAISPASSAPAESTSLGVAELGRLGYRVRFAPEMKPDGYFAGPLTRRAVELKTALLDGEASAIVCVRGGYGSGMLLEGLGALRLPKPKLLIGYSDITMLHTFLWQRARWTSIYGPMVAAGFHRGEDQDGGYDRASFTDAVSGTKQSWSIPLGGEALVRGQATGVLLGGCLTLLAAGLGTPSSLDTRGAILLLEDVAVKPYQLDRMLLHLEQAGKLRDLRGVVLGDFPDCDAPAGSSVSVRDVCRRVFGRVGVPVIFGAAFGHTRRPMLTLPLGVRARLTTRGEGNLEILEPAALPAKSVQSK